MPETEDDSSQPPARLLAVAALGSAVLFAGIVVVLYFLALGDDEPLQETTVGPEDGYVPFGGTPIAQLEGIPTPLPDTGPIDPERPEVGDPAPDFALADVRDPGTIRRLSDYAGTPIVLNWYASWCGPCKDELPDFQAAQVALGDDITFLAVNFVESRENALKPIDEFNVTFPTVLDNSGEVSEHYRILYMPTTLLIDADGIVQAIHSGPLFGEDLERELTSIGIDYAASE